jgi:hypothetical protein
MELIREHNIPHDIAMAIWHGINQTSVSHSNSPSIRSRVETRLLDLLSTPPSFEVFSQSINSLPNASAGGISGLTYNQLKAWPDCALRAAYSALSAQWYSHQIPAFFKLKWLVPLSKLKEPGTPTLLQLRPIVLIEVLRKIWTNIVIQRIKTVLEAENALNDSQFGFRHRRSTEQPVLQLTAALEQTAENGSHMVGSSWDIIHAFDSVAKPFLLLIMRRAGIPLRWALYLIALDLDSRILVRTPWAEHWIRTRGPTKLLDVSSPNPFEFPTTFLALRGVGQGDVG